MIPHHEQDPVVPRAPEGSTTHGPPMEAPGSWEDIVRQHHHWVLRRAYRLTGNRHDAQDLTQDAFINVFRKLSTFQPGNFEAWLNAIITNLHRDRLRRARLVQFTTLTVASEGRLAASSPGPAELHEARTLVPDIRAALESLPAQFRVVVSLRDLDGMSYQQVGEALGISVGTVRSRLHRGRARLRAHLAHRRPHPSETSLSGLEQAA